MAQAQYWVEIRNDYLGKYRRVTGRSRREVEVKVAEQLQRWSEQEMRAREREAVADEKERARIATDAALALVESYRSILRATLTVDDRLDWSGLMDSRPYSRPRPTYPDACAGIGGVPRRRPLLERFSTRAKAKRLGAEEAARSLHANMLGRWEHESRAYEDFRYKRNQEVAAFRKDYETGASEAIERYVSLVLASSALPDGFNRQCDIAYSVPDRTLIADCVLPAVDDMPTAVEYRYIASRRVIETKQMKDKELAELYEAAVVQCSLRTIHEIFEGDYGEHCDLVVLNGWIDGVDRATGKDFRACIISVQAERQAFQSINLARVDPRECFRALKGISGASLATMQPVRPIRTFDKEDPRFIEAAEIIDGLEADQNLMTMAWQDFEILVRDLFGQMFSTRGGDVKMTRASRDHGVDAVIFDHDPVTGGKMIVQAKRYQKAVPTAAVRELYGTMLNEGAAKGLLVTTSHFGPSASEFAKDKPITLIDGAHLLHLMQNHGHRVRIDLKESKEDAPVLEAN